MQNSKIVDQDIENVYKNSFIDWNLLKNKTIFITGANGSIGQFLVYVLLYANEKLKLNLTVIASVRNIKNAKINFHSKLHSKALKIYQNDVLDEIKYKGKVEYIIHCANGTQSHYFIEHPVDTFNVAVFGTDNILKFALKKKCQSIVYLSSMEVYGTVTSEGKLSEKDLGEIDIQAARSSYPMGKRAAEILCFSYAYEYNLPVKIARLAQVVNPNINYNDSHLYAYLARCIVEKNDIVLNTSGNTLRSFCYITDAINAILLLLLKGENGNAYNVSAASARIKELAADLAEKYGVSLKFDINNTKIYPKETMLDLNTEKLEQLGWRPLISSENMWSNLISCFYMKTNRTSKYIFSDFQHEIFSIKNKSGYKVISICGIKIKINLSKLFEKIYKKLPIIPNKIVFSNFNGKGYGCNPKYIAQEILKRKNPYDLVWLVENVSKEKELNNFPAGIRLVKRNSKQALKELASAKIWIDNHRKNIFFAKGLQKKKGQYYIQTWHGSLGIKKLDADVKYLNDEENKEWVENAKYGSSCIDFLITNSQFEDEIMSKALWYNNEKKQFGHPRNDIFFQDVNDIVKKVKNFYGIKSDKKILLYAPSFRDDYRIDCYGLDYEKVLEAMVEKFGGDWVCIAKFHPRAGMHAKYLISDNANVINGTDYPDIQELLAGADIAITDYSSCIFDFMLSGKPGFIFAVDKKIYDTARGLYYPLEETPFPLAENNSQLINNILNFDNEKYQEKVKIFLQDKGCIEDGHASERVVDLIEELMSKGDFING